MSERQTLLREIAKYDFAIVELNLFLDTHPNSVQARNKLEEYRAKSRELTKKYEEFFGPISQSAVVNQWEWITNPWPWNNEEE